MENNQKELNYLLEVFYQEDEIVKLFNRADHKLYYAKHTGKKKIVFDIDV